MRKIGTPMRSVARVRGASAFQLNPIEEVACARSDGVGESGGVGLTSDPVLNRRDWFQRASELRSAYPVLARLAASEQPIIEGRRRPGLAAKKGRMTKIFDLFNYLGEVTEKYLCFVDTPPCPGGTSED